ncbi:MAG TPA: isoprenylcysteine carboxylmethyltransferase family protein [Candidatus Sulfotelmatobacter sp.]
MSNPKTLSLVTLGGVILCWLGFAAIFIFRKAAGTKAEEAKRDRFSFLGILLQMSAYALVWFQPPRAPVLPPIPALSGVSGILFSLFVLALAAGSVWLTASAVRTLGRQWAVTARLVEGHKLITAGPYAYVRNPIYTGMLGMLIATGLAMEHWKFLIVAIVLFSSGLVIRVRSEEKLLRAAFGQEFEDYARRVPAVVPGIF